MNPANSEQGIGSRITRYGVILAVSGLFCKILLLVYTSLAVDILGQEQFGRIEYFLEMAIIFSVLVDFGLEQTVTREIARRRERLQEYLYSLLTFRLVGSVFSAVVMTVVMRILAKPEHTWMLLFASLTYLVAVINIMLIRAVVRSFELMTYEGVANVVEKIVHIGLALLALYWFPSLPAIVLCYTAGALASLAIFVYVVVSRFGIQRTSYSMQEWIEWQKLAFPIGLSAACILLLHREDTAMVNWICGDSETGLYRAPYRFLEGLFLFPQVIAVSAYPVFSKLFHEGRSFEQSAALLLRGLLLISLPIAVGGACVADGTMLWLTPKLGEAGGAVFKLLLWSLPFIYANFLLGTILNATDRQRLNVRASAWGLASNAVLNIPAIYFWGAYGACVTTIVSQGLYCLIMLYDTRKYRLFENGWSYLAILIACLAMYLSLAWLALAWYWLIPLGAVIYSIALFVTRGIDLDDVASLRKAISR